MKKNAYEILGINANATPEDIKLAYRRMAMKYHPDRNPDPDARQRFTEIQKAYEELSRPAQNEGFDFGDIFGHVFGDIFRPRKEVFSFTVPVPFLTAVRGGHFDFSHEIPTTCPSCSGSGAENNKTQQCTHCQGYGRKEAVIGGMIFQTSCAHCHGMGRIPVGQCQTCLGAGQTLQRQSWSIELPAFFTGDQTLALQENPPIVARFVVDTHPVFTIGKGEVIAHVETRASLAALGGKVCLKNLDDQDVFLFVDKGTQDGDDNLYKGKAGKTNNGKKINLRVFWKIKTPTHLTPEQKNLLEAFEKTYQQNRE